MTVIARSEGTRPRLTGLLAHAGAVFSRRDDRDVAVHYGSPAGELAVCVSAVGLVDRSDLSQLVIEASPSQLVHLTERLAGGTVAPGGALHAAGAWWCREAPERIVVLCEPHLASRVRARVHDHAVRYASLSVCDRSAEWSAIELIGPSASQVLRALGAYGEAGDPRLVCPFTSGTVAGHEVHWLLESDRRALLLAPAESAAAVWQAIERVGRPAGISCVGLEATSRYALIERRLGRTPLSAL